MSIRYVVIAAILVFSTFFLSCKVKHDRSGRVSSPLVGTWQLVSGTVIEKGDTTITHYSKGLSFIKIINDSHFAFLLHDSNGGRDSSAVFGSGGGKYDLADSIYTEHLEYCTDRQWEGHDFVFTIMIRGDTLVQRGIEEIKSAGISRLNIEKYFRLKQE